MTEIHEAPPASPRSAAANAPIPLPSDIASLAETAPPLAVVHRLSSAAVDELAERWSGRDESADTHPVLARLGPAAQRLRELQAAERAATTCPACCFDGLDSPPYLAFEGMPEPEDGVRPPAPPYAIQFGDPSGRRCPCCGYGYGIDDDPADGSEPVTFAAWSRRWLERGGPWFDESRRPPGWSAAAQLAAAERAHRVGTSRG